jgi:hypothetical protein
MKYIWAGFVIGALICYLITENIPAILCVFLILLLGYVASRKPGVVSFA